MPPHPLTNSEIQKYYQNEPRFNGVYSIDNVPKIKDGAYVKHLDDYSDDGTHQLAFYVLNNDVTYFDSFAVELIPKEIIAFISNKNIETNIFRIQACDSVMCGHFCIGFIGFMFYALCYLFSPNNFKKYDDIILNYFVANV